MVNSIHSHCAEKTAIPKFQSELLSCTVDYEATLDGCYRATIRKIAFFNES